MNEVCEEGLDVIGCILGWGDRLVAEKIQSSAALYNTGMRMNEVCEEIFARKPELLSNFEHRECLVDACQRYRWMSVREVDEAFARIPGLEPARIHSQAVDMGRPSEPEVA